MVVLTRISQGPRRSLLNQDSIHHRATPPPGRDKARERFPAAGAFPCWRDRPRRDRWSRWFRRRSISVLGIGAGVRQFVYVVRRWSRASFDHRIRANARTGGGIGTPNGANSSMRSLRGGQLLGFDEVEQGSAAGHQLANLQAGNARLLGFRHRADASRLKPLPPAFGHATAIP